MEQVLSYKISQVDWPDKYFLIKRATLPFDKLQGFFGEAYGEIYGALTKKELPPLGAPLAFYYAIDEEKKETQMAAAVETVSDLFGVEKLESLKLPAGKMITTSYTGPYENMQPAYKEMDEYLKEHGLEKELVIEEYLSDPAKEKDPRKWKTNIYYKLK